MVKVLITGAGGFIGTHLAETLAERGDQVTCLVRRRSPTARLNGLSVRLECGDIRDRERLREAVSGHEVVYHLAGLVRPRRIEELYEINQRGTANVAWACAQQDVPPLLIAVSTQAAAGPARGGRPLTENDPPRPVCHYGRSKLLGEQAARQWADRVPITIVRPCGVFGPWDRNMFDVFRAVIRFGVYAVPVWPTLGVCVIHIADLIHVLLLAAERGERLVPPGRDDLPPGHGVYFAASAERQRAAEVGRMIARAAGRRRVLILPVPSPLVWMLAGGGEMVGRLFRCPPPLSWDRAREGTAGLWHCSCRSAVEQLGFSEPAPLIERFRQTAEWYREHGWL